MYCPQCGTERPDLEQFCTQCGYNSQSNQISQSQPYQPHKKQGKDGSTTSLVCGIIGIIAAIGVSRGFADNFGGIDERGQIGSISFVIGYYFIPILLSIVSIVTGYNARKRGYRSGKTTAGIVLGIIAASITTLIIFSIIYLIFSP
jgi:hypothetical protein